MPKKNRKLVRKMYAYPGCPDVCISATSFGHGTEPVYVIRQRDMPELVEQAAIAIYDNERRHESVKLTWETTWEDVRTAYRRDAISAFGVMGRGLRPDGLRPHVPPPAKKGGGK